MQKKFLVLFAFCCLFAAFSEATIVRGSVPNQGAKTYVFTPDFTGTALLTLIFDTATADLDIRLAVRENDGSLSALAFSESELRQFETLQIGVLGGVEYTIVVISAHGSSPFRMNFDGTFTTTSAGAAGVASRTPELREIPIDAAASRFIADTRKHIERVKGKK